MYIVRSKSAIRGGTDLEYTRIVEDRCRRYADKGLEMNVRWVNLEI